MHKYKITNAEGGTAFLVQVRPEAESNKITGKDSDVVFVDLTSPAEMEAVDQNLAVFLSKKLGIEREKVAVASGSSVEKKIVIVMGMTPEGIDQHLLASRNQLG